MNLDPRDPAERYPGKAAREIYISELRRVFGIISGEPVEGIKVRTPDLL